MNVIRDQNPATGETIAEVPVTPSDGLAAAVATARTSAGAWASTPAAERLDRLREAAAELDRRKEDLADLATREMGKPRANALSEAKGWVSHIPDLCDEIARAVEPETFPGDGGDTLVVREPHGVVAAITPWNFPIAMPLSIVLPALGTGNTVVFKPSELVPLTGEAVAEILGAVLPDGVLNLVHGGGDVGAALVASDVDMIGFIGSRETGMRIMESASTGLKRLVLELGGKDPLIVFADADLDAAAECAVRHSLRNAGQVCCSVERVYVADAVAGEFESRVLEKARAWSHGDGFGDVDMGPLVSEEQRDKVARQVDDAVAGGARLLLGGALAEGPGWFYPATVLAGVRRDQRISTEETFGPVVCLAAFDGTEERAVELANHTSFGLGASVYTGDPEKGRRVAHGVRAGQVGVNRYLGGAPGTPWVGARQSGFGYLGGVEGHRQFTTPKTISIATPKEEKMILEQHYLSCLAQASYLIVDQETKTAAVVDPRRDVDVYLERAEALGVRIEHVLLTHFHADFLAGHLELRERTRATIYLGASASADYPFTPLADGDEVVFGKVRLSVLETPGHTPESISILVFDADESEERPHAVLTGDTLFIGDVGRPDLMASVGITKEELASQMYDSLRGKLMTLPDETLLYPGHGAGSACGKNLSTDTVSTIGDQKSLNYALQPMSKEDFVASLTAGQPAAPAYFPRAAGLNKTVRATLPGVLEEALQPMTLRAALAAGADGAQFLDVRSKDAFAACHLAKSVNIGLDGNYASWAGTILDLDSPIVLIADPGDESTAALRLGRIGLDRVVGYLHGGPESFASSERRVEDVPRVDVATAAAELDGDDPPVVLDVRMPGERENAHVEGSLAIPLGELPRRLDEVPRDRRVLVHCKTGYRSMAAMSLLEGAGFTNAVDVDGGIDAWIEAGLPHVIGEGCTSA